LFRFRKKIKNSKNNRKRKEKEQKKNKKNFTWPGPLGRAMLAGQRSLLQRVGDRISRQRGALF
jgi:hypothetical protein